MSDVRCVAPPARPIDATVGVPGSKSITNRALLAGLLASGESVLTNVGLADDTEAMIEAVRALGAGVHLTDVQVVVSGTGGRLRPGPVRLDAREAGTVARFLPPVLALGTGPYLLDAAPSMRARPMGPLFEALTALGARVEPAGDPGHLPVVVDGGGLRGGRVRLAADVSSQFVSGLLLVAPLLPEGLRIELATTPVSRPYIDMTLAIMANFGVVARWEREGVLVAEPGTYRATEFTVEPDASAASYFFAAAAAFGGRVRIEGLGRGSTQGDLHFVELLAAMGADVWVGESAVEVRGTGVLRGIDVDMSAISDTAPTLAAVAVFADGPTRIRGVGFIRRKESDRIAAVVRELRRLGIAATEEPDGLVVRPGTPRSARVRTYGDHRIAMAFAVVGLGTPGGVEIEGAGCVAKTFPGFWEALGALAGGPGG